MRKILPFPLVLGDIKDIFDYHFVCFLWVLRTTCQKVSNCGFYLIVRELFDNMK